jgi:hypothetical protein
MTMLVRAIGAEADNLRCSLALEGAEAVGRNREKFYQGYFPDLRRNGELQCRDDRRRNEVTIAASYDVQNPFANAEGRDRLFQYRAHLIQSVLGLPSNGQRRQPLALRHPCEFRHTIDVHSPAIKAQRHDRKRPPGMEFFFEVDVRSGPGRISFDYTVRTTTDAVAAADFIEHSRVVRDLWPHTELDVVIPAGVPLPRRRYSDDILLPSVPAPANRRPLESEGVGDVPKGPGLPSAPAPTLLSGESVAPATVEEPSVEERPQPAAPAPQVGGKPKRPTAASAPATAEPVPRRRRRPHRRRDSSAPDRTWLFLILVVGLVFVAMVVALSMNKK